jgi:hypothetical protein
VLLEDACHWQKHQFFFKKKRNDSSSAFQLKDKREAEEALS